MADEIEYRLTITSVSNLKWDDEDHTSLTADVLFEEFSDGSIPFTTQENADTLHGVELWTKAVAGDYGEISEYVAPNEVIPDSVSARQFMIQLSISGLKSSVDAWIETQEEVVQLAYQYSGTFVRGEPMMQSGFVALGYTTEQIDAFFLAASKL